MYGYLSLRQTAHDTSSAAGARSRCPCRVAARGEQTEAILGAKRPRLCVLDVSGVGNSPAALRLLAGAATTVGTTPAKAHAFIQEVKGDPAHPYWHDLPGKKLAVAQAAVGIHARPEVR
jgi:hypothetical protein